jgi:quinol monooxygenase YgiN
MNSKHIAIKELIMCDLFIKIEQLFMNMVVLSNKMTINIQVDITIRTDKVSDFLEIINADKKTALETEGGIISSFEIITNESEPNHFTLTQTVTSKEDLLRHMKNAHYKWKEFMKTGAVLSYNHKYL